MVPNSPLAISSERLCTSPPAQKSPAMPPNPRCPQGQQLSCWVTQDRQRDQRSQLALLAGLRFHCQERTAAPSRLALHRNGTSPLFLHRLTGGTALSSL